MNAHTRLELRYRNAFAISWAPVLDDIWHVLSGEAHLREIVERSLGDFYLSPYNQPGDDLVDADEDAAAASIYAAEALCMDNVESAHAAAFRLIDAIYRGVMQLPSTSGWKHVELVAHSKLQSEIRWIGDLMIFFEGRSWTPTLVPVIRRFVATGRFA